MRLLFDCTYVFDHPHVNSGIQRVVRNVVHHLPAAATAAGLTCQPVVLRHERVEAVHSLQPLRFERLCFAVQAAMERWRARWWLAYEQRLARGRLAQQPRRLFAFTLLARLGALLLLLPFVCAMGLLHPRHTHTLLQVPYQRLGQRYWQFHAYLGQRLGLTRLAGLAWLWRALGGLGSLCLRLPWWLLEQLARHDPRQLRSTPLACQPGDVLVLLDASWNGDYFEHLETLAGRGVRLVTVVYDLIPILHAGFYDAPLLRDFNRWFDWVARHSQGYVAISASVAVDVQREITQRLGAATAQTRWYAHFPLGSELDLATAQDGVRASLRRLFDGQASVYLAVSTIEPRKNHAYLLDAFERLWQAQPETPATLLIIGRIGWKCTALLERIRTHAEYGRRLIMCNDASDSELEYGYRHSKALVFASITEGFGLPLVEAMQRGLPAMASDIPVFHEIGRDFLAYFDLAQPASLSALIEQFEASGEFPAVRALGEWHWPGWQEATQQLVARIVAHMPAGVAPSAPMATTHALATPPAAAVTG